MKNHPKRPSWKVWAATAGAAVATGAGQAIAQHGLSWEAVLIAGSSSLATFLLGYIIPEGNPPQSALDRS